MSMSYCFEPHSLYQSVTTILYLVIYEICKKSTLTVFVINRIIVNPEISRVKYLIHSITID